MRIFLVFGTFIFLTFTVYSLVTGSSVLSVKLPGGLLVGNAFAAASLLLLIFMFCFLMRGVKRFKLLRTYTLIGAFSWLPVSMVLAGNLNLMFDDFKFVLWVLYSLLLILCLIVVMLHSVFYYTYKHV